MEIMHILAKSSIDVMPIVKKAVKKLPKTIGLVTTIQHKHQLKEIKRYLEKNKKKAIIAGQILGCNADAAKKIMKKVDAFLYIGSGEFHPLEAALETDKRVIIANPLSETVTEIKQKDIEDYRKRERGALIRFLSSDKIGILVSLKSGQNKLDEALELKKRLEDKGKKAYIFVADMINLDECENFPFIESWINTACPRIEGKHVINLKTVKENI